MVKNRSTKHEFDAKNPQRICHRRNPERYGCGDRSAGGETVEGSVGEAGDDVRAADWEGKVGVNMWREVRLK